MPATDRLGAADIGVVTRDVERTTKTRYEDITEATLSISAVLPVLPMLGQIG